MDRDPHNIDIAKKLAALETWRKKLALIRRILPRDKKHIWFLAGFLWLTCTVMAAMDYRIDPGNFPGLDDFINAGAFYAFFIGCPVLLILGATDIVYNLMLENIIRPDVEQKIAAMGYKMTKGEHTPHIPEDVIKRSCLISTFNSYTPQDTYSLDKGIISILAGNCKFTIKQAYNDHKNKIPVHGGIMVLITYKRPDGAPKFSGHTLLLMLPERPVAQTPDHMKKVSIKTGRLDKICAVYSTDTTEAHYIADPDTIEALLHHMEDKDRGGYKINAAFFENYCLIKTNRMTFFDTKRPLTLPAPTMEEIASITDSATSFMHGMIELADRLSLYTPSEKTDIQEESA